MDCQVQPVTRTAESGGEFMTAGRSCPIDYRYDPGIFRASATVQTDCLYVVGGLYGNSAALEKVLEIFDYEPQNKHLIFNGDFNWFNTSEDHFRWINETVLRYDAIRGNVETELGRQTAGKEMADCGCAYPEWVSGETVERSNTIMWRLAQTAASFPKLQGELMRLPMHRRIDVGGLPLSIVHGDAQSLSGWGFAAERLADSEHLQQVQQWFNAAEVRLFACSHTCSPVFKEVVNRQGQRCLVANNGAAGMPNLPGLCAGLMTRIATTPYRSDLSIYSTKLDELFVNAIAIPYDGLRWKTEFLAQWPVGSPAYESYWRRIDGDVQCQQGSALG
jgi:hypothetical protein